MPTLLPIKRYEDSNNEENEHYQDGDGALKRAKTAQSASKRKLLAVNIHQECKKRSTHTDDHRNRGTNFDCRFPSPASHESVTSFVSDPILLTTDTQAAVDTNVKTLEDKVPENTSVSKEGENSDHRPDNHVEPNRDHDSNASSQRLLVPAVDSISSSDIESKKAQKQRDASVSSPVSVSMAPTPVSVPSYASAVADIVTCLIRPHEKASAQDVTTAMVVLQALKKLQAHIDNSKSFDACATELAYCGVYLAVIEALKEHPSSEAIQLEGITLLWTCAVNDRLCRQVLRQLGAVHFVSQALRTHPHADVLHQIGYGLLSELLLVPKDVHESLGDVPVFLQLIPLALSALRARSRDNARYVKRVTTFLLRMLRIDRDTTKRAILAADGLKVTFEAMHDGNEESQQRARDLMKNLL